MDEVVVLIELVPVITSFVLLLLSSCLVSIELSLVVDFDGVRGGWFLVLVGEENFRDDVESSVVVLLVLLLLLLWLLLLLILIIALVLLDAFLGD